MRVRDERIAFGMSSRKIEHVLYRVVHIFFIDIAK